ncbi:hypothetical protein M3Y94_00962100 [Aphelenchoides besseyi]|nr:hypothetical protein M3Y94_00962100 [Aphelenchoides besseyi]KAI6224703.1 hypothetical protein M3Y95_00780500 [Aphelenchoides besseyi]
MSYSTLVLVSLLVSAVVADWSTFGFGIGGQQAGCRDISPMCTRLQQTGICKSPAAHICGVTCGQCGQENDNNENQGPDNDNNSNDDNQESQDGNEVPETDPSSDDNNDQFGNGVENNNDNGNDFNNNNNNEPSDNGRADGDEGFFNIHD